MRKPTKPKPKRKAKPAPPPTAAQIDSLDLWRRLSEAVGVSGDEAAVRKLVRETVSTLADEITVDTIGNLFAVKHGPARAPRVLLAAHMDEVGFMIVGLDSDGL
ncbi:MAG: hypothetical protein HY679_07040, partial [Chloroflexi bacterium]|nr:hypothetical protein [Chloroflexota bacterium]